MEQYISLVIAAVSTISGILLGWSARRRETAKANQENQEKLIKAICDLEYIRQGFDEMKTRQQEVLKSLESIALRAVRLEDKTAELQRQVDDIERAARD